MLGGASAAHNAQSLMKHTHYKAEIAGRVHTQSGRVHNTQARRSRARRGEGWG
jgi:hypothetical protein